MNDSNNKLIFGKLLFGIFVAVLLIAGGTYALWGWESSQTQFTNIVTEIPDICRVSVDGGASVESTSINMMPASCTNTNNAIIKEINTTIEFKDSETPTYLELWLNVDNIASELASTPNFKYAVTESPTSCVDNVIASGTFEDVEVGSQIPLLDDSHTGSLGVGITKTYYLYIWLDAAETDISTAGKSFNFSLGGECSSGENSSPEAPVLDDGMIPVVLSADGTATTVSSTDSSWYNYDNKEWANVVLVNENATDGVSGSYSREYYKNNPGTPVLESDILAYYVWIPRYKYRIRDSIQCSELENPTVESNPECYELPYTISDSDKELFINWWHEYEGSYLQDDYSYIYTIEEATEDVETTLSTGEVYIEQEDYSYTFLEILRWYNEENDPDITYTANFNENNIVNVPRTIDITYEPRISQRATGDAVNTYYTHPAFIWDGETIAGFWVGKFETSTDSTSTCYTSALFTNCDNTDQEPRILPNVNSLRHQRVSNQFQTVLKFSGGTFNTSTGVVTFNGNNTYGLTTKTDSHMMKNSEWGAVAYLSHSIYGINEEIRINNYYNSGTLTGCGASTEDEAESTTCGITYGQASSYPQSTTGNITGVYDMSGGAYEYVMGNYGNTVGSGGFSTFPASKYYDLYSSTQFTGKYSTNMSLCTLETCGGHALFETANWYSDDAVFVDSSDGPWFMRGGYYADGVRAGAFYSNTYGGQSNNSYSFRSLAIVNGT